MAPQPPLGGTALWYCAFKTNRILSMHMPSDSMGTNFSSGCIPLRSSSPSRESVVFLTGVSPRVQAESLFSSDYWLRACLDIWPAATGHRLLTLGNGEAFALLGARTVTRNWLLRVHRLALNESLDDALDEPTMELNGFFGGKPEDFERHFDGLMHWLDARSDWDEFRVPGLISSRAAQVEQLAAVHGLRVRTEKLAETWWIDLDRIRHDFRGDYLAALSPNTRQQLRRARRALESEHGPLRLEEAASPDEARAWLDDMAVAHRARWSRDGERSGFDIPSFRAFHRSLVGHAFPEDGVQMLRFSTGGAPFAWIYNLLLDGHAYFLMNGADYARFERFKPGMVAHWLAIEHNLAAGARIYDFLGGSQRYKASMATDRDTQHWLVLWRPRPKLLLEDALRRFRQRWRRGSSSGAPAD